MTVNPSSTAELSIDQIVLAAHRLAGLMAPEQEPSGIQWQKRATFARGLMEMITKSLETEGRLARAWKFEFLSLTAGTPYYSMDADILDVYGDAMYIDPSNTDLTQASGLTPVVQIDMGAWQRMATNQASGRPGMYLAYRAGPQVEIRLWPTPNESGTIRFQTYTFLANSDDGNATPDLERYWAWYLTHALAAALAESAGLAGDKISRLETKAAMLLIKAKGYTHQRTPNQVHVVHGGARRRRW